MLNTTHNEKEIIYSCCYIGCDKKLTFDNIFIINDEGNNKIFCYKHFEKWKEDKAKSAYFGKGN